MWAAGRSSAPPSPRRDASYGWRRDQPQPGDVVGSVLTSASARPRSSTARRLARRARAPVAEGRRAARGRRARPGGRGGGGGGDRRPQVTPRSRPSRSSPNGHLPALVLLGRSGSVSGKTRCATLRPAGTGTSPVPAPPFSTEVQHGAARRSAVAERGRRERSPPRRAPSRGRSCPPPAIWVLPPLKIGTSPSVPAGHPGSPWR